MKKKHVSLVLAAFALSAVGLGGCSQKDEPSADATVVSVKVDGVGTSYRVGETIEWDKISATITYSDKAVVKYTSSVCEFDVATAGSEDTKFIVRTDGLYEKTKNGKPLKEADKTTTNPYVVKIALAKAPTVEYKVADVYVGKITNDRFAVISYSLQTNLEKYEAKRAEVQVHYSGEDEQKAEAQFKLDRDIFTVGTLNEFRYDPDITFIDKSKLSSAEIDNLIEHPELIDQYAITGHDMAIDKVWDLKEINDETHTESPASANDYRLTDTDNGIQFNESAAGKHFKVSVSLADFPNDLFETEIDPVTFEFKVQKGLNIYSAKELGALNLTHFTKSDFDTAGKTFDVHIGNTRDNEVDNVFARKVPNTEEWEYYKMDYVTSWTEFLNEANGGPFTAEELVRYQDVPAVFFMDSFDLKKTDIPDEYFVHEGEAPNADNVGRLRDGAEIYVPIVWGEPGDNGIKHNVEINGNYFNLNVNESEIPLCKNIREGGKLTFYTNEEAVVEAGHAALFKFCGVNPGNDGRNAYYDNQVDTAYGAKGIIRNLNSIGNTGEATDGSRFVLTGLIFAKNHYCGGLYENNIVKQYQIAYFADHMVGAGNNTIPQFDSTFIKDSKAYDIMNCGIFNYRNGGLAVSGSSFDRFGGAPLINAGRSDRAVESANSSFSPDCVFNNEITGQEVYFKALGPDAQALVTKITALNDLINPYIKLDDNFQPTASFMKGNKMNLVSLNMDGDDYLKAGAGCFHAGVTINKGADNEVNASMKEMWEGAEYEPGKYIFEFADNAKKSAIAFATDKDDTLFYTTMDESDTDHYGKFSKKTGDWPAKSLEVMPNFDYMVKQIAAMMSCTEEQARAYALAHRGEPIAPGVVLDWHEIEGDYLKMYIPVPNGKGTYGFTTLGLVFRLYH